MRPHSDTQIIYAREDGVENLLRDGDFLEFTQQQDHSDSILFNMTLRLASWSPYLITSQWSLYTTRSKLVRIATDCHDVRRPELHPILVDAWFTSKLSSLGIVPKIDLVSPAIALDRSIFEQFNITMSDSEFESCKARRGSLRFLVAESLPRFVPVSLVGKLTVRQALNVGRRIISVLALVHKRGFVHGNIRPETVWINEDGEVKLIDFSRAAGNSGENFALDIYSMSPWQIENPLEEPTIRDDLWRGWRLIAILMHGTHLEEYEKNFANERGSMGLMWWKNVGGIFRLPNSDPIGDHMESLVGLPHAHSDSDLILRTLNWMKERISTACDEEDTQNGYSDIQALFDTILFIVSGDEIVNI